MSKRFSIIAMLLFCIAASYGQIVPPMAGKSSETDPENQVYPAQGVEVKPEYPGGMKAFYKLVSSNMKMPDVESASDIVLKVYVSFVIEKDGSVSDIKVLRDPGYGLGNEAKRVVALSEKWTPGKQNGKVVRTSYYFPIAVNIDGTGETEQPAIKE